MGADGVQAAYVKQNPALQTHSPYIRGTVRFTQNFMGDIQIFLFHLPSACLDGVKITTISINK